VIIRTPFRIALMIVRMNCRDPFWTAIKTALEISPKWLITFTTKNDCYFMFKALNNIFLNKLFYFKSIIKYYYEYKFRPAKVI
jgi:hypothetical protein